MKLQNHPKGRNRKDGLFHGGLRFEEAKNMSEDPAIKVIADGLIELSRGIENDINKLERGLRTIQNKVNQLR
jgi:hypothetical protein